MFLRSEKDKKIEAYNTETHIFTFILFAEGQKNKDLQVLYFFLPVLTIYVLQEVLCLIDKFEYAVCNVAHLTKC